MSTSIPSPLPPGDYADYILHYLEALPIHPGPSSAALISLLALFPRPNCPAPTYLALKSPNPDRVVPELRKCRGYLKGEWEEIAAGRVKALLFLGRAGEAKSQGDRETEKAELHRAYESYEQTLTSFLRFLETVPQSTSSRPYLPILTQMTVDLRAVAALADKVIQDAAASSSTFVPSSKSQNPHLEATARQLNKVFKTCVADRNPDMANSRKWATYKIVAILFRTYFKLKSLPLCRNILLALSAADLPPFEAFPRSDRVTFKYYTGMLHFLGQQWTAAETDLRYALSNCHMSATSQQAQILLPLLPLTFLLRGSLPSPKLLAPHPKLRSLYQPFFTALHSPPSLSAFSSALANPSLERILVRRGVYIAVESMRMVLLRNIVKSVWVALGKVNRLSLDQVQKALLLAGWTSSSDQISSSDPQTLQSNGSTTDATTGTTSPEEQKYEVEWLLGTLIAGGYIKGYLSHERRIMVLSNVNAFPKLAEVGVGGLLI